MKIDKAINNLCAEKTVVIVAHRLEIVMSCDRVAVVENHTIACAGTHDEVLQNNPYYRQAWNEYNTTRGISFQTGGGNLND